jgi:hypothetical protein
MTAQEQGLAIIATAVRQIVPPALDFVVIVFHPGMPTRISSVLYPDDTRTPLQQYEAAKEAAQAFITHKPHASFNPQN